MSQYKLHIPNGFGLQRTKLAFFPNESDLKVVSPGLDGNNLVQVCNIARHFYESSLVRVANSTLERTFLGVCWKIRVSEGARLNDTHIYYI